MRILVIGLGSMGQRRVRDLKLLGHEVVGFDLKEDRQEEAMKKHGVEITPLITNVDAWVISTPPDQHIEYIRMAEEHNIPFFVEAGAYPYKEDFKNGFISCSLRFHPLIQWIKEQDLGQIYSVNWFCQQDIRQWHKGENIKDFYAGHGDTALREMCVFEMMPISFLFGFPVQVKSIITKISDIPIEKDHAVIGFKTDKNIVGTLHVDLVSPEFIRKIKITSSKGVFEWNLQTQGKIMENTYKREIEAFLNTFKRTVFCYPYTVEEDRRILELVDNEFRK